MLSNSQSFSLDAAINGHNIILIGQGGSGKTFVLKKVYKELGLRGKNVFITCSTGIAATQYEKGQTLHSWCGVGDGGIPKSELSKLIVSDERYQSARERIESCDVLIIDECSMVSQKIFETVEFLCRSVRGGNKCIGGFRSFLLGISTSCHLYQMSCTVSQGGIVLNVDFFFLRDSAYYIFRECISPK